MYVSNERPLAFNQPGALDHSVTLAVCMGCVFKLLSWHMNKFNTRDNAIYQIELGLVYSRKIL